MFKNLLFHFLISKIVEENVKISFKQMARIFNILNLFVFLTLERQQEPVCPQVK